jgi:hypothetical protein
VPPRHFEFVPLWQIAVFFVYAMRRVERDGEGPRRLRVRVSSDRQTDPQRLITAERRIGPAYQHLSHLGFG